MAECTDMERRLLDASLTGDRDGVFKAQIHVRAERLKQPMARDIERARDLNARLVPLKTEHHELMGRIMDAGGSGELGARVWDLLVLDVEP